MHLIYLSCSCKGYISPVALVTIFSLHFPHSLHPSESILFTFSVSHCSFESFFQRSLWKALLDIYDPHTKMSLESHRVLTIASHVVFGYVGNSVTTFVLQTLGLEVSALNTVQFSNHTGYKQWTGYKTTASQIDELWAGLKDSEIVEEYELLLTGYVPGADGVEAVGRIAKELKELKAKKSQRFFWVLDPVMGDAGKLYVSEEVVPVYKSLIPYADLITPNQFETELLCGVKIDSLSSLHLAIDNLHQLYNVPHVVITSVSFPNASTSEKMLCAGSTLDSKGQSRKFILPVPIIDGIFVGTGDMFSALTLARLREQAELAGLLDVRSWLSPDDVQGAELPLAKALEKVLGSMHLMLKRTQVARDKKLAAFKPDCIVDERMSNVRRMKASELQLVKGQKDLLEPTPEFKAIPFALKMNGMHQIIGYKYV